MNIRRTLLVAAFAFASSATIAGGARSRPPQSRPPAQPTFADAARLLREGRHAGAYGLFVELADAGNRDAARVALVMHRYGKPLFDSDWDASDEQLADWGWLARQGEEADRAARSFGPRRP